MYNFRRLLIDVLRWYLAEKNICLRSYIGATVDIKYVDNFDFQEIEKWPLWALIIVFEKLAFTPDSAACPWCIVRKTCRVDCEYLGKLLGARYYKCGYMVRHGHCDDVNSTYKKLTEAIDRELNCPNSTFQDVYGMSVVVDRFRRRAGKILQHINCEERMYELRDFVYMHK